MSKEMICHLLELGQDLHHWCIVICNTQNSRVLHTDWCATHHHIRSPFINIDHITHVGHHLGLQLLSLTTHTICIHDCHQCNTLPLDERKEIARGVSPPCAVVRWAKRDSAWHVSPSCLSAVSRKRWNWRCKRRARRSNSVFVCLV